MKNCIYISIGANLPNQNASALRITNIINILSLNSYFFDVIGQTGAPANTTVKINDNYLIHSIYNNKANNSIWTKIKVFFFPTKLIYKKVLEIMESKNVDYIFIYQVLPSSLVRKLIKLSKRRGIQIIFDIVEYQTICQQSGITGLLFNYLPAKRIIKRYSKYGSIISISKYLDNLFKSRGIKSIYVPLVFDTSDIKNEQFVHGQKIEIIYAGAPFGSRDTIVNAVKGVLLLEKPIKDRFHFTFAGVNENQMIELGLSKKELNDSKAHCEYLGRIPHEQVIDLYSHSDYSLLLKPAEKRFSKAGFPTKISESWALSTPVIANLTGDMDLFMVDEYNGFVCKDDSPQEFANTLLRVVNCDITKYDCMRINSRKTAVEKLDVNVYSKVLSDFLKQK